MPKLNKGIGRGWHNDSERHSRARKYGSADRNPINRGKLSMARIPPKDTLVKAIEERQEALVLLESSRKELKELRKELKGMLPETGPLEKRIILEQRNVKRDLHYIDLQEKIYKIELESLRDTLKSTYPVLKSEKRKLKIK